MSSLGWGLALATAWGEGQGGRTPPHRAYPRASGHCEF